MINNSVSGYKNEGAKNMTNTNQSSGGAGTFNAVNNTGTGQPLLTDNTPVIDCKTLLAGAGINIVNTGSELQIVNTISPGVESYGYYKTDTARYVSLTHPNADQPGTNVYTTLQLCFDDIVASGFPVDTTFNILVERTTGLESPSITCSYNINLWILGNFELAQLSFDLQNNNTMIITAPNGVLTCDSIINNSSSSTPIVKLTNVVVTTEITDNSANGEVHIEGCTLGKFTLKQLKHCNNLTLTSNISVAGSANDLTNSIFDEAIDIAAWNSPYNGFKNCYFRGVAKTFNGTALQLDSNSLYTFNANTWTNASGITTILEVSDGVTSVSGSGGTTGLTLTGGPIVSTGTLTLGGTLNAANGGTSQSSYTTGDLLYANSSTTLAKLAAPAAGCFLRGAGVGVAPAWSTVTIPNTVSANRLLVTNANAIVTTNAMTNGQLLIGWTSNTPLLGTLTAGAGITITNGAGSITIATNGTGLPSFQGQTNGIATVSTTLPASPGTAFHSYTIPANTLNTVGDSIVFEWHTSQVETVASTLGGYLVNLGTMSPALLGCAVGFTNSGSDRFDHIVVTITRYSPSAMSVRSEAFLGVGTSSATASGCRSNGAIGTANWTIAQTISLGMYNSGTGTLNGRVYCSSVKYYLQ